MKEPTGELEVTTTAYHVEDGPTAEQVCLQLAGLGWTARWGEDQSWTHVYVIHARRETTRVNRAVLTIDMNASACHCRLRSQSR